MITKQDYLDNQGGNARIYFTPVTNVAQLGDIYNGYANEFNLHLTPMDSIWVLPDSLKFKQSKKSGPNGNHFPTSIKAMIPKDRPELLQQVEEMDGKEYVCVILDNNDYYKIAGTIDEPLRFTANVNIDGIESLNAYGIEFARSLRFRSPFVENPPIS